MIPDYIEDIDPTPSLYPKRSDDRALTLVVIKLIELYLEMPSQMLLPNLLQDREPVLEISVTSYSSYVQGCMIINNLCSLSPYLMDANLTIANIFLGYTLKILTAVKQTWSGKDPLALIDGLKNLKNVMKTQKSPKRLRRREKKTKQSLQHDSEITRHFNF